MSKEFSRLNQKERSILFERDREKFFVELKKETDDIINSVGQAALAWSILESNLLHTFSMLAFRDYGSREAGIIFYSPNNFETRLGLVRDMFEYGPIRSESDIVKHWGSISSKITNKKKVRNKIIHGSLVQVGNIPLWRHALGDVKGDEAEYKAGQLAGLKSVDICRFTESVSVLCERILLLNRAVAISTYSRFNQSPPESMSKYQLISELNKFLEADKK